MNEFTAKQMCDELSEGYISQYGNDLISITLGCFVYLDMMADIVMEEFKL